MAFVRYNYGAVFFWSEYIKWIIIQKVLRPKMCLRTHKIFYDQIIHLHARS